MTAELPPPRKSWWERLNEKPAGWDDPGAKRGRLVAAVLMGLGLLLIRLHH